MNLGTPFRRFLTHQFSKLCANRTSAETRRNFELREATRRIMVEESITSRRSRRSPTSIFSHPRFRRFIEKAQRKYGVKVHNPLGVQRLTEATNRKLNLTSVPLAFREKSRSRLYHS